MLGSTDENMNIVEGATRGSELVIMADVEGVKKTGVDEGSEKGSDALTITISELTDAVVAWNDTEVESNIKDLVGKIERLEPASRDDDKLVGMLDDCSIKCEVVEGCWLIKEVIGNRKSSITGDELIPSFCCGVGLGLILWKSVKNNTDSLACDSEEETDRDSMNNTMRSSFPSAILDS